MTTTEIQLLITFWAVFSCQEWCGAISVDMILLKSASFLLPLTNQEPLCVWTVLSEGGRGGVLRTVQEIYDFLRGEKGMMHVESILTGLWSRVRGQPRKVDMKTLVSRLSVACHQRSGKYSTYQQQHKVSDKSLILDIIIFLLCLGKTRNNLNAAYHSNSVKTMAQKSCLPQT